MHTPTCVCMPASVHTQHTRSLGLNGHMLPLCTHHLAVPSAGSWGDPLARLLPPVVSPRPRTLGLPGRYPRCPHFPQLCGHHIYADTVSRCVPSFDIRIVHLYLLHFSATVAGGLSILLSFSKTLFFVSLVFSAVFLFSIHRSLFSYLLFLSSHLIWVCCAVLLPGAVRLRWYSRPSFLPPACST